MVGMLNEGGATAPERPVNPPMPTDPKMAGEDQMLEAEEDVSEAAIVPLDEATQIAYSDRMFPKIVKMFEKGGAEGFPKAMATSLLGIMQKMESESEAELSDEVLAEVGVKMFEMLAEDIATSGTVDGLTPEIVTQAVQESIKMWAQANPDRFDPALFEQEAMAALEASGEMPPVTANPEPRNMVPDESAQPEPAMPPQGGGMLSGGM